MKKLLTAFVIGGIFFTTSIVSCKSKDVANDPKSVLVSFFERMGKKDLDGAEKLSTKDSKATIQMMKKGMEMAEKMKESGAKSEETEKFEGATFGDAKIDGDNATVPVKLKDGTNEMEYSLKKEDGSWKVDFSMSALMKMGLNGAKEGADGTENNTDSLNNHENMNLDSLSNLLNSDSLKNAMEQATKALDELKTLKDAKIRQPFNKNNPN